MSGTTSRLALPYPTEPDTPDVPLDISALTTRLETLVNPATLGLPSSPYDGQVAYYQPTAGVVWAFRWNNSSGSSYKWEFCGGPPLVAVVETAETLGTVGGWSDPATVGPSIVLAHAGDYDAEWGATLLSTTTAGQIAAGPTIGAGTPGVYSQFALPTSGLASVGGGYRFTDLPASSEARLRYYAAVSGMSVNGRRLRIRPVRIA
jgi:hypothetical protein